MFSTAVAWVLFVFISVVLPAALLEHYTNRPHKQLNYTKLITFVVLWFVSGVYLFG